MYHTEKIEPPIRIYRPPVTVTYLWKCSKSEAYFVYTGLRNLRNYQSICYKASFAVAK